MKQMMLLLLMNCNTLFVALFFHDLPAAQDVHAEEEALE